MTLAQAGITMNSPATEQWLSGHRLDFKLREIHLTDIDRDESHRNQARIGVPVNDDHVLMYASAMEQGDEFPAIVVYQKGKNGQYVVIDGNHRVAAHDVLNRPAISAYIIDNPSDTQVRLLTYEANTKHGIPTELDERVQQAVHLVELGANMEDAATRLNIPKRKLDTALRYHRADVRAAELQVHKRWANIPRSTRARLANVSNDNVFTAMAGLVSDAKLSGPEVDRIVVRVNAKRTEADQLGVVAEEITRRKDEIRVTASNRLGLPPRMQGFIRSIRHIVRTDLDVVRNAQMGRDMRSRLLMQTREAERHLRAVAEVLEGGKR